MTHSLTRRRVLAIAGATALGGCSGATTRRSGGSSDSTSDSTNDSASAESSNASSNGSPSTTTRREALPPLAERSLQLPMTPTELRAASVSGGVPRDGIPAIDEPVFEHADAADDRLDPGTVVFGLAREGVAKAYPQSILVWHEICNDIVDDTPVSVTYCPLTGTAMGFERGTTTFGVSGRLINNNLVMYDRATEHWWPQVLATAIPGWSGDTDASGSGASGAESRSDETIGRSLREIAVRWTTWERWRTAFPNTRVLTEDTGYVRQYGLDQYGSYNPREGYYAPESDPLFEPLATDDRYPPKVVVIGVRGPEGAIAFHEASLRRDGVLMGEIDGVSHVAVHDDRLDTGHVYRNPANVSVTPADDDTANGSLRVGDETHPPADLPLERRYSFDAMWFAWRGFYPAAGVYA